MTKDPLPPTIRPARHDDEAFLLELMPRLADFPLPAWRTADEIARGDRAILLDAIHGRTEHAAILVAELSPGGERAGYVFATTKHDYFTRAAHAHVEIIAVTPEAERRGVARALMDAIEQWAGRRGYRHVTLNVFDRNARAKALYDSLGYERETIHFRKNL
jgi:ribosomal protein S18 acetylase RimI-like enzyme